MKGRRSKLEIYIDVLKVIKEGAVKPTRIMYGSNLAWNIVNKVLTDMASQDLITEHDVSESRDKRTKRMYEVTSKGIGVIKYFDRAKGLIEVDDKNLNTFQHTK
jgi:predicted transcriptional regulator